LPRHCWRSCDGAIAVEIALSDPIPATAAVTIPDLAIVQNIQVTDGRGSATIAAHPDLWSPETPRL
jgi:hypothetical protein